MRAAITLTPAEQGAVDTALTTTRAVRKRLDLERPVDPALVEAALQVAHQGPSGGGEEPVRWIVVTDPQVRRRVGESYREAYAQLDQEREAPTGPGAAGITKIRGSSAYLATVMTSVPVQVLACTVAPAPTTGLGAETAKFYASIYPAVWSLQVALRARGLGSCLTTIGLRRSAELAAAVNLPPGWTCCALLPVAHVTGDDLGPAPRRPLNEVTTWI
ncbi:nitroreductase family protein [Ornithinimicrobium faecis]|uniref:nitroreductase family protein n=1 Tax=Ornithinimicrobium faecis TaxID=2934158 RepID=UPI002118BFF8|nr:nitroreductase family protein [Ornithinimicrobium sp. HY1745]